MGEERSVTVNLRSDGEVARHGDRIPCRRVVGQAWVVIPRDRPPVLLALVKTRRLGHRHDPIRGVPETPVPGMASAPFPREGIIWSPVEPGPTVTMPCRGCGQRPPVSRVRLKAAVIRAALETKGDSATLYIGRDGTIRARPQVTGPPAAKRPVLRLLPARADKQVSR